MHTWAKYTRLRNLRTKRCEKCEPQERRVWVEFEFIGVLRHMQQYFRHMWRHRCAGGPKKKLYLRLGSQRQERREEAGEKMKFSA